MPATVLSAPAPAEEASSAGILKAQGDLSYARAFTTAYREHLADQPCVREAACLAVQYPYLLAGLRGDDRIAGRLREGDWLLKFAPQAGSRPRSGQAGFCMDERAIQQAAQTAGGGEWQALAEELIGSWRGICTWDVFRSFWDDELRTFCDCEDGAQRQPGSSGIFGTGNIRIAGAMLDYDLLIRLGIPGLRQRITAAMTDPGTRPLRESMLATLDLLARVAHWYRDQAVAEVAGAAPERQRELVAMADALDAITRRAPGSLREAVQLFWLYVLLSEVGNFTRMDVYFGDLYVQDVDSGAITAAEAQELLAALWRHIDGLGRPWDTRIVVGGRGRRNPDNADRFALAAIAVTRAVRRIAPVLTLRLDRGQDPELLRRGLDVIGEGCLYPTLYNDEVLIPALARHLGVSEAAAEGYLPLGCGEFVLDHSSLSSPNTTLNLAKCLEAVLHDGCDPISGRRIGPATGGLDTLRSYADVEAAMQAQIAFAVGLCARHHVHEYEAYRQTTAFLFFSILTDDCIARGRSIVDGGLRWRGGCVEGFGFTNAGDSLHAIRQVVFEQRRLALQRLVEILDADFAGAAVERRMLLSCAKFGNDDDAVDAVVTGLARCACREVAAAGRRAGLDFFIISNLNPGGYDFGWLSGAGADGRGRAQPFAIGNAPTAGSDSNGLTASLRSVAKTDPENGGFVTNLKISREFFTSARPALEGMLAAHFACGGQQLNLTVVARGDLEGALEHPERYPHLLVRVGGWSARYIDLDKVKQREILARTLH